MNTNQCFKKNVDGLKRQNSRNEPYENWSSQQKEDKTKKILENFFPDISVWNAIFVGGLY